MPILCLLGILFALVVCRAQTSTIAQNDADLPHILGDIRAANIEHTIKNLVGFGTRNTLSVQDDPKRGIGAARDYLYNEFEKLRPLSGNRLIVEKQSFLQPVAPRVPQPTTLTNIVATLPGESRNETPRYVVVSGHYDSMCTSPTDAVHDAPGANDDASGSAAVLEMARAMVRYHYRATIVFVCVAGEEQGLLGATYLADHAKSANWNIEAMFTNDIIGNTNGGNGIHDDRSVRVFSEGIASNESEADAKVRRSVGGEDDSASRQIARYIKEIGEKSVRGMKVMLISRRDRYGRGGDHIPFNERGFPAIRFTEPNEEYRHQHQDVRTENGVVYGDLPQFVDYNYVAKVARINASVIASLVSAPDVPKNVGLSTRGLSTNTDLEWAQSKDTEIAGYEIVWRETSASDWQSSRAVGNINKYTAVGLSKDNYFFGVRALDKQGRRSPVAFPHPVR